LIQLHAPELDLLIHAFFPEPMESRDNSLEDMLRQAQQKAAEAEQKAAEAEQKAAQKIAELERQVQRLTQQEGESSARGSQSGILNPDSQSII